MTIVGNTGIPAIFLHHESELREGGGGVQLCTREYFATLTKAGFALTPVAMKTSRRLKNRLGRYLWPNPYEHRYEVSSLHEALDRAKPPAPEFIFLNQRSLGKLLPALRSLYEHSKVVILSHGLESTDYFHELREIGGGPRRTVSVLQTTMLGARLLSEGRQAVYIDHVFCLSEFELSLEHWLGVHSASLLPRIVNRKPLDWKPAAGRLGYVGTLDHRPNREALELFLNALAKNGVTDADVRLVGGPPESGEVIARRYPFVTYLGQLDDEKLIAEASSWSCFLHPLFCYARGASTKLAIALGWEIPIVTTRVGARGYSWTAGSLPMADDPEAFAKLAILTAREPYRSRARVEAQKVAASSPTADDIATQIRSDLRLNDHALKGADRTNRGRLSS